MKNHGINQLSNPWEEVKKQTSKKDIQDLEKMEEYAVNATIHLGSDVPEEVQQFIKSIYKQEGLHQCQTPTCSIRLKD